MKSVQIIIGGAFIAVAMMVVAYSLIASQASGSVQEGQEYKARQLSASNVGTSSIKFGFGSVGSIVISSTTPGSVLGPILAFYDTASTTIATTSMSAIFTFGAANATTPPPGTYTFDVGFGQGIYLWVNPAFSGSYTITYR